MNRSDIFADPLWQKADDLTKQLTEDEKLHLLSTHHRAVPRLGLDEFFIGHEVARGFVGRDAKDISTVFPQPVGLAGTFDKELMHSLGEIAGRECRAYYNRDKRGCLCVWGPTVDMERDPRWGRTEEAYGEDVCLAGEMTAAYTRGMAGSDPTYYMTVPTLKHFCANNNEKDRASCNAYLPPRLKYEYYYAAFMNAIRFGGARSVMTAYNEINGIPGMLNPELDTVLKEQWGMWFAVTDGGDFSQTVTAHSYFENHAQTIAEALRSGCDSMTDVEELVAVSAKKALDEGLMTWEDVDRSVRNTLYARLKLGHTADDCPWDGISEKDVATEESERTCLRAASEQMVLLKNDGLLPFAEKGSIAVLGPLCNENLMDWYTGHFLNTVSPAKGIAEEFGLAVSDSLWDIVAVRSPQGKYLSAHEDGTVDFTADTAGEAEQFELQDWGENWQNLFSVKYQRYVQFSDGGRLRLNNRRIYDWFTRETFHLYPTDNGTVVEELFHKERLSTDSSGLVSFTESKAITPDMLFTFETLSSGRERGQALAEKCRYVVYCTGNHPVQVAKECFDRKTLELNIQPGMAEFLHSVNPDTVLALISSYPYSIVRENEKLPAIIYSTHAGAHLGTAIAQTLSGKNPPAGRLAMTWYRSELDLPDIMDYDIENAGTTYMYFKGTPLYPFGYGLSYASFEYTGLSVSDNGNGLTASVNVKNISDTDSDEAVQLYYTLRNSQVTRPVRKLCAFERVHIPAGKEVSIELEVPEHILQIWDVRCGSMITETGSYIFSAGGSSEDLPVTAEIYLQRQDLSARGSSFEAQSFDKAKGAEISWDKNARRHYVTCRGWNGKLIYEAVPAAGKDQLRITACSVAAPGKVYAVIEGIHLEIPVNCGISRTDFAVCTADLPGGLPDNATLELDISEFTSLLDIELI